MKNKKNIQDVYFCNIYIFEYAYFVTPWVKIFFSPK